MEDGSWGIYGTGSRYEATTGEDTTGWENTVWICSYELQVFNKPITKTKAHVSLQLCDITFNSTAYYTYRINISCDTIIFLHLFTQYDSIPILLALLIGYHISLQQQQFLYF
jgi:hypothetical protein